MEAYSDEALYTFKSNITLSGSKMAKVFQASLLDCVKPKSWTDSTHGSLRFSFRRSVSYDALAAASTHGFYTPHISRNAAATKPTRDYTLCCADKNRHDPGQGKLEKEDRVSEST